MSETVNIYEAKTQLSKLVARAEVGEEIILSRHGRAVARIVPLTWTSVARTPGIWKGKIVIHDDFDEFSDQDDRDWYGE
jgi:prevent-host-death family protein